MHIICTLIMHMYCTLTVHVFCTLTNAHVLYVDNAQMAVVSSDEGPASSVASGDDIVIVGTLLNGTVNALKLELELLPAVGEVNPLYTSKR